MTLKPKKTQHKPKELIDSVKGTLNKRNNNMIVVEIYGYENKERTHYIREFTDEESWERDYMIRKLSGTWVGHKIYRDLSMREWAQMTPEHRMILTPEQKFDKEAFLKNKSDSGITMKQVLEATDYVSGEQPNFINTNDNKGATPK
jgi:carbamoylphosphate synthase large subunit